MAPYQTNYSAAPAKGIHGQVANEEKANAISRTVENAEGIYFGTPVQRGTGDHGVIPLAAGAFIGIAKLTHAVPPVANGATMVDGYPRDYTGAFLTDGQMYVTAGGAVADGGDVYYNTATRRYVAAGGTNIVGPLPGVKFDTSGANGDIVEISLKHRSA